MYTAKPSEKLLKKKDVAEMLACSVRTIDRLVVSDGLTRVKVLGATRYKLEEVETLIRKGEQ